MHILRTDISFDLACCISYKQSEMCLLTANFNHSKSFYVQNIRSSKDNYIFGRQKAGCGKRLYNFVQTALSVITMDMLTSAGVTDTTHQPDFTSTNKKYEKVQTGIRISGAE